MKTKRVSSEVLLKLIYEAYKGDAEGLLDDLRLTVEAEESLLEFAQQAVQIIELDEEEQEIDYEEDYKRVPALVNVQRKLSLV